MSEHILPILFVFALGACVGSFLNVVVYRLPRSTSLWGSLRDLSHPPSHCPKCSKPLAWYDNIPIFGWILLKGKCRYCGLPIAARYPAVELATALLFAGYYVAMFLIGYGPRGPAPVAEWGVPTVAPMMVLSEDWAMYGLYMVLLSALLAASLIDAELYIIPIQIPWALAVVGIVVHGLIDQPGAPGALNAGVLVAPLAIGGGVGLLLAIILLALKVMPISFPNGEPALEVDAVDGEKPGEVYTAGRIRREILKELLFITPALVLGIGLLISTKYSDVVRGFIEWTVAHRAISGMLGSLFGALFGGLIVWLTRIFGTLGFGRVAMGLGDVHLMFGVGAVIGATVTVGAFFIAPFFGIALAIYMLITGQKRELPYGPYLSAGTALAILLYYQVHSYLTNGAEGLMYVLGW